MNQKETNEFIHKTAVTLRPADLVMNDVQWKFLVRNCVQGENIMMTGPTGTGKTKAAKDVAKALRRELYYFNLGATQDPRATLIGNVTLKDGETKFANSAFIRAIQEPNSIILLDELTRAHPDAHNILMTVLDEDQRYLRIDEEENSPIINVADGVCFIATANIGNEYTATRTMDRALTDRFTQVRVEVLNQKQEFDLLKLLYPSVDEASLTAISTIAHDTRENCMGEDAQLNDMISTRVSVKAAKLLRDGFSVEEIAEVLFYPLFADDELKLVKQLVQKHLVSSDDELYSDLDGGEKVPEF